MEPLLTSLRSSFRRVPAAAIPPMLDCILASAADSPSSIFSSLLDEFPQLIQGIAIKSEMIDIEWRNFVGSYVAALCHLLKTLDADHMQMFIWKILIPLLELVHADDVEIFNEVASLFLDLVTETNSWEVFEATMVLPLLRSISLSTGMFESEQLGIHKWSIDSNFKVSCDEESSRTCFEDFNDRLTEKDSHNVFAISRSYDIPLSISYNILNLTLDASLSNKHERGVLFSSTLANGSRAKLFAGNMLWDLSNLAIHMLSKSVEHRSCAVRFLLPLLFKALACERIFEVSVCGKNHVLTRKHFVMKLWKCCKLLFSSGSLERRDAYDILSLCLSFSPPNDDHQDANVGAEEAIFDLRADKAFWDEIKRGLLDKDGFVRKQSLQILKRMLYLSKKMELSTGIPIKLSNEKILDSHFISKRGRWADNEAKSLGVGRVCHDNASNLTGWKRWEAFVFLYEMLEEYGIHLVEAAWNHQIMLWLRSLFSDDDLTNSENGNLYCNQMASTEQTFQWLAILWERGFCHDNPQVRCLIMESFLDIDWKNCGSSAKLVPMNFILGPLIQALNDPVQHKNFGSKEVYSSRAIKAAARFLFEYASVLDERQHISFLVHLASAPKLYSFGRAGLMCLAECIASASSGVMCQNNHEFERSNGASSDEVLAESAPNFYQNDRADLLDVLRFILECSKQHFNPNYRSKVCERILASASSAVTAVDVPLEILLRFIASLPREYTDVGGYLRYDVKKWLRGANLPLLTAINGFPPDFISYKHPLDSLVTYDDEELKSWEFQAKRWARVLFLVVVEDQHLDPILKFILDYGGDIFKNKNHVEWVEVKFLILVSSLIEELQVILENSARIKVSNRNICDLGFPGKLDNPNFMKEIKIFDKFIIVLLLVLEELVSFTKSSCSIFWSPVVTKSKALPGSVRGRLGGQSQRRLLSSSCTSVLEAITSVKSLASVLRLCAQFRTNISLDSAHTLLWSFCWKIITSAACKSEVEAEICTAAYEACSYALKNLVTMFSPLSLDLILRNSNSSLSEVDDEPLLDLFISTFLHNINSVIDGGKLARTRRTILMNWKWSCLESLLSLPKFALRNGVCMRRCKIYFSDSMVRQIFDDLVGSLENAGEFSVLPMLRSVKLCMEFLTLRRTNPMTTSCDSITIKMMWFLVRSSWILHVSCNKRRVASIASLLSSVLHYSVFADERMHEFDCSPGPLKWFVEKILEEGAKSPRTIRLAVLQLAGLWLAYPHTLKYYMKELKLLTLYGSVAFDEDFEAELSQNYDARIEVSVLSRSLDPDLTEGFINTELYARVSVAVLFSKLADMADLVKTTEEIENSLAAMASGKSFLLELLNFAESDKDISKELYKKYSAIHRRKVRVWQMICVLSRFVDLDMVEQVSSKLHTTINRNNLPSVRQYMETFAIHVYLKFPLLVGQLLVSQLRNYDLRPQALSSYVFIAANIILHANKETKYGHLDELLPPIIPLLTSHHHTLRGFTQILVFQVLQKLLPDSDSGAFAEMSLEKKCFVDLRSYLANNLDCARLRSSMEGYLDEFNPTKSVSPHGIFANRVEEDEFECVPTTLMDRVIHFLNETREDLRSSMATDAAAIKNESLCMDEDPKASEILDSRGILPTFQKPKELLLDFQKKITFSKHELQHSASAFSENMAYRSLLDMENEDQLLDQLLHSRGVIAEKLKTSRQQILIFASLIDRIPNLAGLARTCEVFRAAGLAIADKTILTDKQFQLISVTADKWVPIVEVPPRNMKLFLEKKKKEGFAILGLEQTANSIALDKYNFPIKTVLVLGHEKEGIPVDIIHILDACVEIPQLGVVRSLNVHVSGAIALWEYTRQQRRLL
ncbi:uncharacterized protein [Primulina huaijiensis]|uniref:uncharacterized protein n=1 Tax=Primulina huaijiensis TaxID=1492673 RepID=UPI003CC78372